MSRIVGIDLGIINSLVAAVDAGIPFVIADSEGHRLTPSVVHFPDGESAAIVGRKASRLRVLQPESTIYSVKRFIGRRANELSQEERLVAYGLSGKGSNPVSIELAGRTHAPEKISAEILRKLKSDAERCFGEPITRAVITVPAYFNDAQRSATKRAGELAGLTVERIINEPTAAALAYGLDRLKEKSKIAVYDLGGGTFDLSILELNEGVFQVLATNGNTRLGGDDLDKCIVDFFLSKISQEAGSDLIQDPAALARVREAAEQSKIRLSTETEIEVSLPFLTPSFSFSYHLTRAELEDLTRDVVMRTKAHCVRALADAKLEPKDLDQIILVGGQTRMPLVRRMVTELFGCAEFEAASGGLRVGADYHRAAGPILNTSQNPDEAVAIGAAIQAEILSGGFKHLLLLDVTPLSLGLETFGGLMNVLIPRNSTIPVKAGEVFTTAVDGQASMLIHVLQGERDRAKDNWSLGRFNVEFESAPRGVARVGVQFEIDANGILHVLARDLKTGREKIVDLKSAVDVDDTDVQRMVEESVEHAFDDLKARRWVEAKLRASDTMAATRKGLAECGAQVPDEERARIEAALRAVDDALASEQTSTNAGELERLRSALAELDEATRGLAELMMDRAVEVMLRQRGMIQ